MNQPNVGRRGLIASAAGAAGAVGLAALAAAKPTTPTADAMTSPGGAGTAYPFHGKHQAGIVTPAQDRLHFAAFDISATSRAAVVTLLRDWTAAAAQLTAGELVGGNAPTSYDAPPVDTGESIGLPASGLTLTFGFGPSLFVDDSGQDRFGLAARRPAVLEPLPHFPADRLDPRRSGGDLCIQACADDPQVAVHAIRNLSRIAFGRAALRWAQLGFGRTSSTTTSQATPRNLFGFKDGTANITADETEALRDHVWVGADDDPNAAWLAGGSYLVARRIKMQIETWDRTALREQETVFGRDRREGAPLSGGTEFTAPNFAAAGSAGPLIDVDSHVRLAHPDTNDGVRILRRGYNFTDGSDALGRLDAGLFFLAYLRNPATHFVPLQQRLARSDRLNEYIQHTGSALFAVPPGVREGGYVGEPLFS